MSHALHFREVHKAFGRPVLTGLSGTVSTREVTFVAGASGSGKSVLCRLAAGLLRPDAGEVELFGESVHHLPERALRALRRRAPYLVQGPALLDWRTLRENAALADRSASPERVLEALARVGLADLADRLPTQVGPGAKKRTAIARALVLAPEYLLMDEPTTGLDRVATAQVEQVLVDLKRSGLGALVVSHDYRLLSALADRVLVVAQGRTAFIGTPAEFLASSLPEVRALTAPYLEMAADG